MGSAPRRRILSSTVVGGAGGINDSDGPYEEPAAQGTCYYASRSALRRRLTTSPELPDGGDGTLRHCPFGPVDDSPRLPPSGSPARYWIALLLVFLFLLSGLGGAW